MNPRCGNQLSHLKRPGTGVQLDGTLVHSCADLKAREEEKSGAAYTNGVAPQVYLHCSCTCPQKRDYGLMQR